MELSQFMKIVKAGKKTLALSVLAFLVIAVAVVFVQPFEYAASTRVLIVQNNQGGTDPFVASKANEYLGGVISGIVTSNAFFDEVLNSSFNIDKTYFDSEQGARAAQWRKMARARSFGDLGIVEITIWHTNSYQAKEIADAVDFTLKSKTATWLGTGDKVSLRVIDQPTASRWPDRPNILLIMLLGPAMGLVFGLFYLYLFEQKPTNESIQAAATSANEPIRAIPQEAVPPVVAAMPAERAAEPIFVQPEAVMQPVPPQAPAQAQPLYQYAQQPVQPLPTQEQTPAQTTQTQYHVPEQSYQQPPYQYAQQPVQPQASAQAVPPQPTQQIAAQPVVPPAVITESDEFDLEEILNQGNINNLL
ncbi:hypothetical protein HGA64_04620 [Candidatus Falkowbacteria bacterium]|nr:hypothetical protein [Candidatus Falkowbacteria bacterium]